MKSYVKWGVVLIGGYLVLRYRQGAKSVITSGAAGTSQIVKTFQGR